MTVRALIAGFGQLGTLLANQCAEEYSGQTGVPSEAAKFNFFALSRAIRPMPENTSRFPQDMLAEKWGAVPRVDYVFFTATPGQRTEQAYRDCYLRALKNLVAHLDTTRLKRFFFISSTSVFGANDGSSLSETDTPRPVSFSGKVILEAETWLKQQNFPVTAVRFGGIYGGTRNMLIRQVLANKHLSLATDQYTNRIHEHDCARVMQHLMKLDEQGFGLHDCYIAVDGDNALKSQVYNFLASALGRNEVESVRGAPQGKRCSNNRLLATGFQFTYPSYREGYIEMLAVEQS